MGRDEAVDVGPGPGRVGSGRGCGVDWLIGPVIGFVERIVGEEVRGRENEDENTQHRHERGNIAEGGQGLQRRGDGDDRGKPVRFRNFRTIFQGNARTEKVLFVAGVVRVAEILVGLRNARKVT